MNSYIFCIIQRASLYLLVFICFVTSTISCSDDEPELTDKIKNIAVLNDASGALHARVKFEQYYHGKASISYWMTDDQNESSALSTTSVNYRQSQSITLPMLEENKEYNYRIVLSKPDQTVAFKSDIYSFKTVSVPTVVREFYIEEENQIDEPDEGYFLFHTMTKPGILFLVNNRGKMVWYRHTINTIKAARVTPNNTLLTLEDDLDSQFADGNILLETTWGGDTLFHKRTGQGGLDKIMHHDMVLNEFGHFVIITNEMSENLPGDGILVLDRQGNKMWEWSTFDHLEVDEKYQQPWANSIALDHDNHFIVSFRSLSQVWKIHAQSGQVLWKLGKNGNINLTGNDTFLFQHFAHRDKDHNILLFDNGSNEQRTLSRVISFAIDENTRSATSVVNAFLPDEYYSNIMGSAFLMPDNNLLVASAVNGKIIKLNKQGEPDWTLKTTDRIYRVEYIESPFVPN